MPLSGTTCVCFDQVSKRFADVDVLEGLNLELAAGRVSAIVGESGSGKSTLLQLVNAVHRPDRGAVKVFGETVPEHNLHGFRRRIGYAVQGAGLFPHLTVTENITLLPRLESWDAGRIEERYQLLMDMMAVDVNLGGNYPHQLSGGQQQRVGLCRALMLSPELLLLDEPFSALDPITRADIQGHFRTIQQRDAFSTILVTHDMQEAAELASYLVILQQGRVLQAGSTDEVLANPADDYVRRLFQGQPE